MKNRPRLAPPKAKVSLKEFKLRVGRNIRRFRKESGLNQEDMIFYGFNVRHFQDIEGGKISVGIDMLWKIARVFGVDPTELTGP
jgi:transcriptional regulator with XRE-family HTH domain